MFEKKNPSKMEIESEMLEIPFNFSSLRIKYSFVCTLKSEIVVIIEASFCSVTVNRIWSETRVQIDTQ